MVSTRARPAGAYTGASGRVEKKKGERKSSTVKASGPSKKKPAPSRATKRVVSKAEPRTARRKKAEAEEPEETSRTKRARRGEVDEGLEPEKSRRGTVGDERTTPANRIPDLVERAWYQAGSVIIKHLRALIGDDLEAIRQSKVLLEMDLVAPDAFAEVWGGRPDLMRMKKAELVKLGQAAGIKGLHLNVTRKTLGDIREKCKDLAYLSLPNYALWRAAEKREVKSAISRLKVLPDEPLWLENLINKDRSGCATVLGKKIRRWLLLPPGMVALGPKKRYRLSLALVAAAKWQYFTKREKLNVDALVSLPEQSHKSFQRARKGELELREKFLGRVAELRKEWEKAGAVADLDEVLESGGLDDGRYHHTREFIARGGNDRLQLAVKAMKAVKKWGIRAERAALKTEEERLGRFETLSAAFKKNKLAVPVELDPADAGVAGSEVHRVRQQLNISWEFISLGRATVDNSVKAHKAWLEYRGTYSVSTEREALVLASKMARWAKLAETWDAACGFSVDDVHPGRGISAAARRTLDVTVGYIEHGGYRLDRVRQARKTWIEYRDTHHVSSESAALALVSKMARWAKLAKTWDAACGFSIDDVHPGRPISDATRHTLDVTVGYIERGDYDLGRVRQAHAAYVKYKELRDTESQAVAHKGQLERCEEVKAAWVEHQVVNADQLCVPVPPKIAKKYPVTTGYILGTTTRSLDGVIAARLEMRDKKRRSEDASLTLEDLKRDPRQNNVFICHCGYYSGAKKMTGHLKLNQSKAVPDHKKGYN